MNTSGGPAFPVNREPIRAEYSDAFVSDGLSKREWFAGQCLAGMMADSTVSGGTNKDLENYANYCYRMADAMIAEGSKPSLCWE